MIGIDSNIIIYAFDTSEGSKHLKAKKFVQETLTRGERLAITNQVCAETHSVLTVKSKKPLTKIESKTLLKSLVKQRGVVVYNYDFDTVLDAIASEAPFWDALLAQTLLENGVHTLYTENVKDFRGTGIRVVNPLS